MTPGWFLSLLAVPVLAAGPVEILVLYDNTAADERTVADWGFSALVKTGGATVLFDAGAKPDVLFGNMRALGVRTASITHTVISHAHGDHMGGIHRVMSERPSLPAYFPDVFPAPPSAQPGGPDLRRVAAKPVQIAPGVWSTGQVEGRPPEQALVVDTARGLVVVTGCSHPGAARMVEAARTACGAKPVRLLLGGFHMLNDSGEDIRRTVERLRALGVESVAATHCTGDGAIAAFGRAYGKNAVAAGVGKLFTLD